MSMGTDEVGAQTCGACGQAFPSWSMFCTHCGKQTVDSKPGSTELSAMAMARGPREQPLGQAVRTRSTSSGTAAIVFVVLSWVMCFLFWIPAFVYAKKSRQKGESIAGTATSITWWGFMIWLLVVVAYVAYYIWFYDRTGQVPGQQPTGLEPVGP
jgi:heme/copper-type cytochrome/quinol oxidase subunit 2